jgi:hypothetical protein
MALSNTSQQFAHPTVINALDTPTAERESSELRLAADYLSLK